MLSQKLFTGPCKKPSKDSSILLAGENSPAAQTNAVAKCALVIRGQFSPSRFDDDDEVQEGPAELLIFSKTAAGTVLKKISSEGLYHKYGYFKEINAIQFTHLRVLRFLSSSRSE